MGLTEAAADIPPEIAVLGSEWFEDRSPRIGWLSHNSRSGWFEVLAGWLAPGTPEIEVLGHRSPRPRGVAGPR